MSESVSRVKKWKPPVRPDWVQRINEEGSYLDIKSVVPLDADSIISHAQANTGLSDFGADEWVEPFHVLLKSLNEESGLNLMGRIMTRADLIMYLEARLRIEDTYKKHPEIEDVELASPTLIVGSGRSGTSAIQNLLNLDPENGTTQHWEAVFPCPPPEKAAYKTDPRIARADKIVTLWNRVTPEIMAVHEFGGQMPTEMIHLQTMSFHNAGWTIFLGFTPTYTDWVNSHSQLVGLLYAKRAMKLLQWKNPYTRWMLKSPESMLYLPEMFQAFHDMKLVWMHRDPVKTVSSAVNMVGTILWLRSDQQLSENAIQQITDPAGLAWMFNGVIDQIEQKEIPADRIYSVQYADFVLDPVATIDKLYQQLGIEFTPVARQAMENHQRDNPREARPAHNYSVGDREQHARERELFKRYQSYFKVPNEV